MELSWVSYGHVQWQSNLHETNGCKWNGGLTGLSTDSSTTANSLSGVFPLFWYNKEKGADTMMNPTMLDPIALAA